MQGMLAVLVRLADQNGSLPALHDGPYRRAPYAREIAEIVEIGLSVYGDKSYRRLLDNVYRELNGEAGGSACWKLCCTVRAIGMEDTEWRF